MEKESEANSNMDSEPKSKIVDLELSIKSDIQWGLYLEE